jgi:hypothetical protein
MTMREVADRILAEGQEAGGSAAGGEQLTGP